MKNFTFVSIFLLGFIVMYSQNGSGSLANRNDISNYLNPIQNDGLFVAIKNSNNVIDETQYLFPSWNGDFQIYVSKDKGYTIKNLNYNINSKKLESKFGKDSIFQFDANKIIFIKNNSNTYKFYNFEGVSQLCQELYLSKNIIFVKNYKLIYIDSFINPMTNAIISKARYEIKEKLLCKFYDNEFIQFDLKKKNILKLMGEKASVIEKYVSDSKLSFSSENDLIKIFNYYDTL
jgi:hypothetical protein